MSKTSNKIRRFALFGLAAATATGVTTAAPPARADEVTATVFSAPGWDYANVRTSPDTNRQPMGQVQAGQTVKLICYQVGEYVKGPYSTSNYWYKVDGYGSGWIVDSMLSTGSDLPVTRMCPESQQKSMTTTPNHSPIFTAKVNNNSGVEYVNGRIGPTTKHINYELYPANTVLALECWTKGESVSGPDGKPSDRWYYTTDETWVSAAYLSVDGGGSTIPDCNSSKGDSPTAGIIPNAPRTWPKVHKIDYDGDDARVADSLLSHYYKEDGNPGVDVSIDWSFFSKRQWLKDFGYRMPVGAVRQVDKFTSIWNDKNVYVAVGAFALYRTSEHCFLVYDYYDFDYPYTAEKDAATRGEAQEFNVYSAGCYQ